ncbi:hypothetical protein [Brevundimonas sp. Root1423]|uniref:hypothetical protein n=1 Tax=Brevundimonas sp. Root1423 TaxID=1736462 RepID=UPI000B2F97AC|nr:hypothetical protein [Brevundimonas sp. Root1423]
MRLRAVVLALTLGHFLAALTTGIVLAATALVAKLVSTVPDCANDCSAAVSTTAPQAAAGAILMAILVALVAAFATAPATVVLSPLALWLDRRRTAWTTMLAAGGLGGFFLGLPLTILTLALLDWRQLTMAGFARTWFVALPEYGPASALSGAVFAGVLVWARRSGPA